MASSIPYDVVHEILDHINLGDHDSFEEARRILPSQHVDTYLYIRRDPLKYLSSFTNKPEQLLAVMRATGSIISGSRALEYFNHGACDKKSDWDIFCSGSVRNVIVLTAALSELGVKWDNNDDTDEHVPTAIYASISMEIYVLTGRLQDGTRVQVISRPGLDAFECITKFHSSVVQCYISGHHAVSMYNSLTSKNKFVHWAENYRDPCVMYGKPGEFYSMAISMGNGEAMSILPQMVNDVYSERIDVNQHMIEDYLRTIDKDTISLWMADRYIMQVEGFFKHMRDKYEFSSSKSAMLAEKYTRRGFQCIKFDHRESFYRQKVKNVGVYGGNMRHVGDEECYTVDFRDYLDDSDGSIEDGVQKSKYIFWLEELSKTSAIKLPMIFTRPLHRPEHAVDLYSPQQLSTYGIKPGYETPWLETREFMAFARADRGTKLTEGYQFPY